MPRAISFLLYLGAFTVYAYSAYYTMYHVETPKDEPDLAYAGKAKYLTHWNLCLCVFYFGLCLAATLVPLKCLRGLRDYIFCSVSLPSCIFVTTTFWALYAYDRELIFPKRLGHLYPDWLNHCSHTLITVTAIGEAFLHKPKVPSKFGGLVGALAWLAVYQVWVLYLGILKGVWVYPLLRRLSAPALTAYFAVSLSFLMLLHMACNALLRCRNRRLRKDSDTQFRKII
ncbi:androgen-dependent TFPI-regulating protein [Galendromus occidentalis]|uniref:Androgen-dependent TFPI-regulating protein n=1 Tax=Galendromus occidentalis TaxID=34638 RepID=A0AAJ6QV04_9ACAR|nr:androgen-dependent TFPI-regulating protein [Galendromus occidentalis]XP_018496305.1 androgen-dependent TFPI-regulating protein [Galendromus occidentalis]